MFLSKLSKRERHIAYITAIVLVFFFFSRVMLRPIINKLNDLNQEIAIQEKRLEKSLNILFQEDAINSNYKKYVENLKQTHSDEEEIAELLSEIEKIAKKTAVFLSDIKPLPVKKVTFYKEYVVELEAESEIASLIDFIYQLEKSPRLLKVEKFHLTPKKEKGKDFLKVQMSISEILVL